MQSSPEAVVTGFYRAWFLRDVEACVAYLHDDVRLAQHFEDPDLPFTGETKGRDAFKVRLHQIFEAWEITGEMPLLRTTGPQIIRSRCLVSIRHRATRDAFDATLRHVWMVENGQITELDEYVDVERLKAFLRLLGMGV